MNRRLLALPALLALLGAVAYVLWPAPVATVPTEAAPPATSAVRGATSVVVVIACTLRADEVTPYGGVPEATPFLAERAAEGTRFSDTIAQAPWTRPAITAILTGRHAISIGMVDPDGGVDGSALDARVTTLAERFSAVGYRTFGATANPNGNAVFGFSQGFDHYYEPTDLWRKGHTKVPGSRLVEDALQQVAADKSPFYLQLLMVDAHRPTGRELDWQAFEDDAPTRYVAEYRAMLRNLDDALRGLSEGLAAQGWDASNTTFVVIGDHGEGNRSPEHHGKAHGNYLYPSSVHVPWLMWGAGVARAQVVSGLTAQIDVVPTLSGLYDLDVDETIDGLDLSDRVAGDPTPSPTQRVYADTWFRSTNRAAVYTPERFCQADFGSIVTVRSPRKRAPAPPFPDACFDWRDDPHAEAAIADEGLMRELRVWRADRREAYDAWIAGGPASPADIDDTTRSILEGLGYLE